MEIKPFGRGGGENMDEHNAGKSKRTGFSVFKWMTIIVMILLLIFFFFYFVLPVITSNDGLDEDIKVDLETDEQ